MKDILPVSVRKYLEFWTQLLRCHGKEAQLIRFKLKL